MTHRPPCALGIAHSARLRVGASARGLLADALLTPARGPENATLSSSTTLHATDTKSALLCLPSTPMPMGESSSMAVNNTKWFKLRQHATTLPEEGMIATSTMRFSKRNGPVNERTHAPSDADNTTTRPLPRSATNRCSWSGVSLRPEG